MDRRLVNRGLAVTACLALALLMAGCGDAATSATASTGTTASAVTAPPDGSPTSGLSASAAASNPDAASEEPTGSPAGSGGDEASGLCATDQQPCPLDAGTYTTRPFEPEFTFTVDDGWTSDRVFKDGGQVSKGEASFVWASSVSAGAVAGAEVEIESGVTGFLAHLARYEGFDVSSPEEVTVDGVTGTMVDVTTNDVDAPGIYFVEEDRMNLVAGEKARFLVLDKDGETVILIIDAWQEEDFDSFLEEAQPLVDSIRWQ